MSTAANEVTVTVTHAAVESFFLQWEKDHRNGLTLTPSQALELSPERIAKQNADRFWKALAPITTP